MLMRRRCSGCKSCNVRGARACWRPTCKKASPVLCADPCTIRLRLLQRNRFQATTKLMLRRSGKLHPGALRNRRPARRSVVGPCSSRRKAHYARLTPSAAAKRRHLKHLARPQTSSSAHSRLLRRLSSARKRRRLRTQLYSVRTMRWTRRAMTLQRRKMLNMKRSERRTRRWLRRTRCVSV